MAQESNLDSEVPPWEQAPEPTSEPPPWEGESEAEMPPWEEASAAPTPQAQPRFSPNDVPLPAPPPEQVTPDQPSPLDRIGGFLSRIYRQLPVTPFTAPFIVADEGGEQKYLEENVTLQALNRAGSGINRTLIDTARAPGEFAEAVQNLGETKGFEPTWKAPVSSMLVGSSRLLKALEDEVTIAPKPTDGIAQQLPEAFGSAAAFMAMGAAGGAAGFSPLVSSAALGGAVGAVQQYDDAVASGASPEQAALAYAGGAAFGLTEAVPGAIFLDKLNKLSKGAVTEAIKKYGIQGEGNLLMEFLKGGLEEAVQEGVQQAGSNWVASDLAGYDPSRALSENFWSSVVTGGLVGSFIGGGLGLLRKAEVNTQLKEMEFARNQLLATGDPINYIEGNFTPVGDLLNLNQMLDNARQQMETRMAENDQNPIPEASSDIISPEAQVPNYTGQPVGSKADLASKFLDSPINPRVEKALPATNADGTPTTVRQALASSPIVAVDVNPYTNLIDKVTLGINKFERNIAESYANGEDISKSSQILQMLKNKRIELMAKSNIADRLVAQIKQYASVFTEVLNPDMKMIVTSVPKWDGGEVKGTKGFFALTHDVTGIGDKTVPVGTIYVDVDQLATEIYNNKKAKLSEDANQARRSFFETLNHELGHSIAVQHVAKLYREMQSTDGKVSGQAYRAFQFMAMQYREWLQAATGKAQSFLLMTQFAPERAIGTASHFADHAFEKIPMTAPMPKGMGKEYLLSFDEFFAEMTARLATQGAFASDVMTRYFQPVLAQYQHMFNKLPAFAKSDYAKDWKLFLHERTLTFRLNKELERVAASGGKGIINVLRHGLAGFNPNAFAGLESHLDRFDKLISWGFNLMQIVKENPHIVHLQTYLKGVAAWSEYQRNFQADANEIYKKWRSLGKVEASQLTSTLFDEALEGRRFDDTELGSRLTSESRVVYNGIREQLDHVLEQMREVAILDVRRTILDNEEALAAEEASVNEDFDSLKAKGYFPFIRFGKFTITARAKEDLVYNGSKYKRGALISFPAFETEKERDIAIGQIRQELGNHASVASSIMRETDFVIQGMPRSLLRSLRNKLEATGDLTPDQARAFEQAMAEVAPFRNFRKHLLKKKGIEGYSEDALRSFAYYIRSAAGHIARVKFSDALREPIAGMQEDVEIIKERGGRADERQELRHWLDRHFSYIMNPDNEWAALRGVGFVAYLGFNVKSAFVNSTQMLTTVAPYLASRYGDVKAVSELTKATWTLKDWIANKQAFIDAMPDEENQKAAKKPNDKKLRIAKMIERGKHEGWLDQSLATELAIAASQNNLDRGLYLPKGRRFWHEFSRYSALPFHLVEKMNRYITAIAAYNLEFEISASHEKAVLAARQANWSANYENARWNRPQFMRGKKSVFFLFANYLQNTLYFATHDKGAVRYWLMMLLLAGLQGLPGAEDVADLVDFTATYFKRMLGYQNPKTQIRRELRDHLEELGFNPDLVLHGLSQDTFGLGHVGEMTGIPIPHLDMSRSVGAGDILPLTEVPSMFLQAEPNDILVAAARSATGAGGNLVEQYYRNLMSDDPNEWKRAERLLPIVAARNVMKAARLAMEGKETTASGDVIGEFDPFDTRDQMEILAQGLGFQPARLVQGWERIVAVRDMTTYYKIQQEGLLRSLDWSFFQEDREAKADAMSAIRKYNSQVPQPEMKLTNDTIKASLKSYLTKQQTSSMGLAAEKKYRRLREEVESSYPDPFGKTRKEPGFSP